MFEVEYKGANSVVISTKKSSIVIDPKLDIVGLNNVKTKGCVELATEDRFATNDDDSILNIEGPGEYGVAGFDIRGVAARRHIDKENEAYKSTIYRIMINDIRIGVIGNIDKKISDEQLESIGLIDILIIPVGGNGYTLDATDAASIVRLVEPKIVIPIHYADNSIKYEVPQDELSLFVSEMGVPIAETTSKYKFKQLPVDTGILSIIEITRTN